MHLLTRSALRPRPHCLPPGPMQRVRLTGLPQGPGAGEAARTADRPLEVPQLWTLLLWSIST
jgi:hypothetical protein